ncbi:MAG: hypothetical protein U0T84_07915 [Chitinophagales bacterium]
MKLKLISSAAILVALLGSCKKDQSSTTSVDGSWRILSGTKPDLRYVIFSGGEVSQTLIEDTSSAAHEVNRQKYRLENNVLLAAIQGSGFYQYSIKTDGDTMWLTNDPNNSASTYNFKLLKDNSTPSVVSWVKPITFDRLMNSTAAGPLAIRSGKLVAAPDNNTITTVNYTTRSVESAITTTHDIYSLDNFGVDAVISDYDKIVRINGATGATMATSASTGLSNSISAIAYDGLNSIWCYTYSGTGNNLIYYFDAVSGVFGPTRTCSLYLSDLAMKNSSLYGCDGEYIYKINPASLKVEQTYQLPGYSIGGIASDGTDFYLRIYRTGESLYVKTTLN